MSRPRYVNPTFKLTQLLAQLVPNNHTNHFIRYTQHLTSVPATAFTMDATISIAEIFKEVTTHRTNAYTIQERSDGTTVKTEQIAEAIVELHDDGTILIGTWQKHRLDLHDPTSLDTIWSIIKRYYNEPYRSLEHHPAQEEVYHGTL